MDMTPPVWEIDKQSLRNLTGARRLAFLEKRLQTALHILYIQYTVSPTKHYNYIEHTRSVEPLCDVQQFHGLGAPWPR